MLRGRCSTSTGDKYVDAAENIVVSDDVDSAAETEKFCVDLPVHSFADFDVLENELDGSAAARKRLVSIYQAIQ